MSIITLNNVRLSFPVIWKAKGFNEGDTPKFGANFLLDKEANADQILEIKKHIKQAASDHFNGSIPKGLKFCLNDGEEKAYEGYEGCMYVSTSGQNRPSVIDRDRLPLVETDGRPYAGCYVNAAISLWVQDNKWGKKVNANLVGLQFVKDGETFGSGSAPAAEDLFADLGAATTADVAEEAGDDFLG
jgi:hypothetical protein